MTTPDPVKAGIAALNRLLAGQSVSSAEQEALSWLDSIVGARRSLAEYAPRTRRRYLAAASRGQSARQANAAEYQRKRTRKAPTAKPAVSGKSATRLEMERLAAERNTYLPASVVDWDVIDNFVDIFGEQHVLQILRNEVDSIKEYVYNHNREPGNRRWHNRVEEEYPAEFNERLANTDILYFYHGVRI